MQTRVVVIGAGGMLGHKMFQRLRDSFPDTFATMRESPDRPPFDRIDLLHGSNVFGGIDVLDFESLSSVLRRICPSDLVNCVGIIKQRHEAADPILSISINSLLPHRLAALAATWGGRLIHFSTDCVFSGDRGGYTERDESDARDLYGRSKFLGEAAGENALTLRTSIIGRELVQHRSLLDWFLAQRGRRISGFRRVIYSGVTTNHLSDLVAEIVGNFPSLHGLYQVVSQPISKYDLLCMLRDAYRIDVALDPDDAECSDRSMSGEKLKRATGYEAPPWSKLVEQLASDSTPYESWLSS